MSYKMVMYGWKNYAFAVIFFIFGIIFDHFILHIEQEKYGIQSEFKPIYGLDKNHIRTPRVLKSSVNRNTEANHSIEKNLDKQYKDYLPRKIFINCGGTFPVSVGLFKNTYPNSSDYHIFSFIPESSYKPLYSHFKRHTFIPAMCGDKTGTIKFHLMTLTNSTVLQKDVKMIGISEWILDNTHPDEYLILKLDIDQAIMYKTLETISNSIVIDWIVKMYVTSSGQNIKEELKVIKSKFHMKKQLVEIWNDSDEDYSDIDALNPPVSSVGKTCAVAAHFSPDMFVLLLYSNTATISMNVSLTVVLDFMQLTSELKNYLMLFLPPEFATINKSWLNQIFSLAKGGTYHNITNTGKNTLRNEIIRSENIFGSSGLILKNVLLSGDLNKENFIFLTKKRKLNVYKLIDILDITHLKDKIHLIPEMFSKDSPKHIFAVNLDLPNSELLIIHLLTDYRNKFNTFHECVNSN